MDFKIKFTVENINNIYISKAFIEFENGEYDKGWDRNKPIDYKAEMRISYPYPIHEDINKLKRDRYGNNTILYIKGFYVRKNPDNQQTELEKLGKLKGLGYLLFCHTMNSINPPKDCVVLLDASGGVCKDSKKWILENNKTDAEIQDFYNTLSDFDKMVITPKSDYLIRLMCTAESNYKLVEYYKKLGFKEELDINEDPLSIFMKSDISTLLNNCNK